jgi:DNA-binding NtrC family response regulator
MITTIGFIPHLAVYFPEMKKSFLDSGVPTVCAAACYQCVRAMELWSPACLYIDMADRVLIIDDDEQLVEAYRDYLSDNGYEVDCAQELEEAQTLLAHLSYSLVITDLRLNKLAFGGLDVIKHVRDNSLPTRVIVVTAYGWPELKAEATASGADAFLRKPMRLSELGKAVIQLAGARV